MNLVDSSGWLEYFSGEGNARFFAVAIENTNKLVVPTICIYEVFKWVLLQRDLSTARTAVSDMHEGKIIDIDVSIAMSAAELSIQMKLPMADSLILACARAYNAIVWTQDSHFKNIQGVKYIKKK